MKPCLALSFILASACATPQLAHTVTEVAATASHRVASSIVAVITHSPAGVHHYTAGAVLPHPVNPVAPGSAIAPIAYICLLSLTTVVAGSPVGPHSLEKRQTTVKFPSRTDEFLPKTLDCVSLTTVDMIVLGFTVLDVANNPILVTTVSGRPRPNTFFSRDWELSVAAGQSYSIFDIVETGPNFAEVEEQSCRLRTACGVQKAVVTGVPQLPHHRLFTYSVATVNTSVAPVPYQNVDVAAPVVKEAAVPEKVYTHAVVSVEVPPSTEMLPALSRPHVCPTDPPWLESPRPSWRPTLCPLVYGDRDPEYENCRSSLNFVKSRK